MFMCGLKHKSLNPYPTYCIHVHITTILVYLVHSKSHKHKTLLKDEIKMKYIFKCLAKHDSFILLSANGPRVIYT